MLDEQRKGSSSLRAFWKRNLTRSLKYREGDSAFPRESAVDGKWYPGWFKCTRGGLWRGRTAYSVSSTDNLFLSPTSRLFIFGCTGSSLRCVDSLLQHVQASLSLWRADFSDCRRASGAWAQ